MEIEDCKCCLYLVQIFGRNETQDRPPRLPWERKERKTCDFEMMVDLCRKNGPVLSANSLSSDCRLDVYIVFLFLFCYSGRQPPFILNHIL